MNQDTHYEQLLPGWHASAKADGDALTSSADASLRRTRILGMAAAIVVHVIAGLWLLSPKPTVATEDVTVEPRMQVVFLPGARPAPPAPPPKTVKQPMAKLPPPKVVARQPIQSKPAEVAVPVERDAPAPDLAVVQQVQTLAVRLEEGTLEVPIPPLPDFRMASLGHEIGERPLTASPVQPDEVEPSPENLPLYPMPALSDEEIAANSSWIWLRVLVSVTGLPLQFEMDPRTAAPEPLVVAAIESLKQWRFQPLQRDGAPVEDWIEIPIRYSTEPDRTVAARVHTP